MRVIVEGTPLTLTVDSVGMMLQFDTHNGKDTVSFIDTHFTESTEVMINVIQSEIEDWRTIEDCLKQMMLYWFEDFDGGQFVFNIKNKEWRGEGRNFTPVAEEVFEFEDGEQITMKQLLS